MDGMLYAVSWQLIETFSADGGALLLTIVLMLKVTDDMFLKKTGKYHDSFEELVVTTVESDERDGRVERGEREMLWETKERNEGNDTTTLASYRSKSLPDANAAEKEYVIYR